MLLPGCGDRAAGNWKLVFPAARDGDWALYVVDRSGGEPVRIAAARAPIFWPPVPSPDGRKLLLPEMGELVVLSSDGKRKRLGEGAYESAAWSPDGSSIVYRGVSSGLSTIRVNGTGRRRLTRRSGDAEPSWTPDGKGIAFVRAGTGVMLVAADGSNLRTLWRSRADFEQLHWSPDGRSLTFVQLPSVEAPVQANELLTLSVDMGRLIRRVRRVRSFGRIAWSPDDQRVAYTEYQSWRIVVMAADGSNRHSVADGSDPVWSRDGQTLVYLGTESGRAGELRSIRPDGTQQRRLTSVYPNGVDALAPSWYRGRATSAPSPYRLVASKRPDGAVLRVPFPVVELSASGTRVALVSPERIWAPSVVQTPPLVLWDPQRAKTERLSLAGCHQPQSLAVLATRVAFDCPSGHAASFGRSILVFSTARSRPVELAAGYVGEGMPAARVPGRVAGSSELLVFSTSRLTWSADEIAVEPQLWRAGAGGKVLIARGPDAREPAAVDGGRIAVERADGQVSLLDSGGRVLGRISPDAPPPKLGSYELASPTVGLSGRDLVVLRAGRLLAYDTVSFRLRGSWRIHRRANLAGVSDGLVAYVVGTDVHVLRLRDGRNTTIRTTSRSRVAATITRAGLFYAIHSRPLPRYWLEPLRPNPATVVFVRRDSILRRL